MKKIMLSMAAVASMMLVACGGSNETKTDENATDANTTENVDGGEIAVVEIDEITGVEAPAESEAPSLMDKLKDATSLDVIKENVTKGLAYVKNLISGGKLAQAKDYLAQLKPYAEKVNLGSAVEKLESAVATAETAAGVTDAVDAAKDKVADVKEQASDAIDATKQKAADIKDQAGAAVDALKAIGK